MFSLLLASCLMSWTAFNSFLQPLLTRFDSKFDMRETYCSSSNDVYKNSSSSRIENSGISLYTSFEFQVKCTSNLESALSVTVHRITAQILIAAATVQLLK